MYLVYLICFCFNYNYIADLYYGDGTTFDYSNRCREYDCEFCILTNWCKIENRGIEWYAGSWVRIFCGVLCIVICCIMGVRAHIALTYQYNNNLNNYINATDSKNYKTPYYKKNSSWMFAFLVCLIVWTGCGLLNVYLWNSRNPIFDFKKVGWSFSFYFVCVEIGGCAIVLLADLLDFCLNRK